MDQRPARRVGEVHHETALAAVEELEHPAHRGGRSHRGAAGASRRLDLHDVGAEIAQQAACQRPGDDLRELEHSHAMEGAGRHGEIPFAAGRARLAPSAAVVESVNAKRAGLGSLGRVFTRSLSGSAQAAPHTRGVVASGHQPAGRK